MCGISPLVGQCFTSGHKDKESHRQQPHPDQNKVLPTRRTQSSGGLGSGGRYGWLRASRMESYVATLLSGVECTLLRSRFLPFGLGTTLALALARAQASGREVESLVAHLLPDDEDPPELFTQEVGVTCLIELT